MDYSKDYLTYTKRMVNKKRYNHTLGVVESAIKLAKIYGGDINKARIAASLHDVTKNMDMDEQLELITKTLGPDAIDELPGGAIHSYSGYIYAMDYIGIDDIDILNAIKNHTLGRPNMSLLEKIIYVADFIEPGRTSEESKICANIAYNESLDKAVLYAINVVVSELTEAKRYIAPITFETKKYFEELVK